MVLLTNVITFSTSFAISIINILTRSSPKSMPITLHNSKINAQPLSIQAWRPIYESGTSRITDLVNAFKCDIIDLYDCRILRYHGKQSVLRENSVSQLVLKWKFGILLNKVHMQQKALFLSCVKM